MDLGPRRLESVPGSRGFEFPGSSSDLGFRAKCPWPSHSTSLGFDPSILRLSTGQGLSHLPQRVVRTGLRGYPAALSTRAGNGTL